MAGTASLIPDRERAAAAVDALDLEPVTFRLMHPGPGLTVMSLAEADRVTAAYRCFLKLCAWHPGQPMAPSMAIDEAWNAHITDTAKYAADCQAAFGRLAHCFPYCGLGDEDKTVLRAVYTRTRELFRAHFGTDMPGARDQASCDLDGTSCCRGESGTVLVLDERGDGDGVAGPSLDRARPRPRRIPAALEPAAVLPGALLPQGGGEPALLAMPSVPLQVAASAPAFPQPGTGPGRIRKAPPAR